MKPPKMTNPPYVTTACRPAPTAPVAGRKSVPTVEVETYLNWSFYANVRYVYSAKTLV